MNGIRVLTDVLAVLAAFAVSVWIYAWLVGSGIVPDRSPPPPRQYLLLGLLYAALHVFWSWKSGLYAPRTSVLNLLEMRGVLRAWLMASAFLLATIFALKLQELFSRIAVTGALTLAGPFGLVSRRFLAKYLLHRLKKWGNDERVLLVGCGETGRLLMKKILDAPHLGYSVVGFLDSEAPLGHTVTCTTDQATLSRASRKVIGRPDDLEAVVGRLEVDQVLIVGSRLTPEEAERVADQAERLNLEVGIVPDFLDRLPQDYYLEDLSAIPLLRRHRRTARTGYVLVKRLVDLVGSLAAILLTSPFWLLASVLIRLQSGGPVIFVQERVGQDGRVFRMFKFRTMVQSADAYAPSPSGDTDSRITPVGRVLRLVGFDELPQLLNVLRGEMSLVGPRPEMPFIVDGYTPLERLRLEVKPGITGLWQISPDRHEQIHDNIEYDLYYRNNRSTLLDALILMETVFTTVEIVLRKLMRPARIMDEGPQSDAEVGGEDGPGDYVLVALDQRFSDERGESWRLGLSVALSQADPFPVKFLTTAHNRGTAEDLISGAQNGATPGIQKIQCVPFSGPRDIRVLVDRAELIVTDLPDVASWASERGKKTMKVGSLV